MMSKIKDAFSVIRNGANIKQGMDDTGYPITRIETISNRIVDRNKMGYAGIHDLACYAEYVLKDGDILMSHINSEIHLGKVAIYEKINGEVIIHGMNLLVLRAKQEIINSRFAYYYLSSDMFLRQIPRITKKSVNQASFNVAALKELYIPIPPMKQQIKIITILDKINSIIEHRQEQLAEFDGLVKSRFVELFGDSEDNPMGWDKQLLSNVITNANNGMARRGNDPEGNIVMRLVELQDGYIDYSAPNRITLTDIEKRRYLLRDKDFLFVRVNGNPENVGRCAVFKEIHEPVYHNDHIIRVHFNDDLLNGLFASSLLNSTYGKRQMREQIKTSAGQYTINQNGIGAIMIILPPLELQEQFATFVEQTDKSKLAVQKSLQELETLKKSLMQQYFG